MLCRARVESIAASSWRSAWLCSLSPQRQSIKCVAVLHIKGQWTPTCCPSNLSPLDCPWWVLMWRWTHVQLLHGTKEVCS